MKRNNVILVGYMGSGKTTLGKKLAKALEFEFIDTDKKIEEAFNISVNEIFKTIGEDKFRELETLFITTFKGERAVIATGGGLPCFNENMNSLKDLGLILYLNRPAKELAHRLSQSKTKRPLLANKSNNELLLFIKNQLNEREEYYNQADFILDRDKQTVDYLVQHVKKHLKQ